MRLHEQARQVRSKADLVAFIRSLAGDLSAHPDAWENPTLERYLEALASWVEDSDGYYRNQGLPIPVSPSWSQVADMLAAASIYE